MLDQGLFKNHFVGRDGFVWWIGQIADENTWKANIPGFPAQTNEPTEGESIGFGERYKVRIMGYHTAAPSQLSDDDLPWATVMYPVTAGGGGRGSSQNANLTQGCFVFGFFLDGDNAQQPVIMGCMGYNDYQEIKRNIPEAKFLPFSGYTPKDKVATTGIKDNLEKEERLEQAQKEGSDFVLALESSTSSITRSDLASQEQKEDGQKQEPLSIRSDCRPLPIAKILIFIKNLLIETQKLKRAKRDPLKTLTVDTNQFDDRIRELTQQAAKLIAGEMKWITGQVQKTSIEKVNTEMKKKYFEIPLNERQKLKEEVEEANDLLSCLFRNIMNGLETLVFALLEDMVKKAVTAPPCAAENVAGSLIGQIADRVQKALNGILSRLDSLLDFPNPLASMSEGGGMEALDIIADIISLLECDEKPGCPEVTELSLWDGGNVTPNSSSTFLANIAKEYIGDPNRKVVGASGCNSGPVSCGPPTVKFFGSRGSGAAGNLIISALGQVMGIDMVDFGVNYDRDANAVVVDTCGKGQGAVIRPVISTYTDPDGNEQTGITNINVIEPGTGYLTAPDGSTGGDGQVWANPEDTTVTRADGEVEIPYPPGNIVTVTPGDIVLLPPGTEVVTEPLSPSDIQQIAVDTNANNLNNNLDTELGQLVDSILGTDSTGTDSGTGVIELNDDTASEITNVFGDDTDNTLEETISQLSTDRSGNEKIPGGKPHIMRASGKFTTPSLPVSRGQGEYPSSGSGAYPAIMYLCKIIVSSPGINYSEGDQIIIEPNAGATAVPKFNSNGSVESVKITSGGEGFTQMPDVYIKSETGFNAELKPVFCVERIAKDEVKEYDRKLQKKLISVVDCVGKVDRNQFVGYVNGKPYYGPFHVHAPTGVAMVGERHIDEPHDVITDTPNTITKRPYINQEDIT